jgi:hypothetical protein
MTDFTGLVQRPNLAGATPVYTQCTAADFFVAQAASKYELHYVNAATPTTQLFIKDPVTVAPTGATPGVPTGADGAYDRLITAALGATTQRKVIIDNSNEFRDSNGRINLKHNTPTTLTLNIVGPL